jgi:hypothetical protein
MILVMLPSLFSHMTAARIGAMIAASDPPSLDSSPHALIH